MLNYIWLGLIALAVVLGAFKGNIGEVGQAAIDRAIYAVYPIGTTLLAMMTLWLGLMRLADRAGLVHRLGLALRPILRWLFPRCRRTIRRWARSSSTSRPTVLGWVMPRRRSACAR